MHIGGVMLGAGMVLNVPRGAYVIEDAADFSGPIRLTVTRIGDVVFYQSEKFVFIEGEQKHDQGPWEHRKVSVKVKALREALTRAR